MSQGGTDDLRKLSGQNARSALISTGICAVALAGFYLFGGKQAIQSAKTTERVRSQQEAAEQLIEQNSQQVEGIVQELQSVRGALASNDKTQVDMEETRKRVSQLEQSLSALPRLTSETRAEIDAASSRTARHKAEFLATVAIADKCEQALLAMKDFTAAWTRDYEPLLSNDRGRRIAANKDAVQKCATILRGEFPGVKDAIDWQAEFKAAVAPLRAASANGITDYVVTAEDKAYFDSLLKRVTDANRQLDRRQRGIDAILATTSQNDPGQLTLAESIKQLESDRLLAMVEEATRLQEQKLRKVIVAQAETVRKAQEERIKAETKLRVQQEKVAAQKASRTAQDLTNDELLAQAKARTKQLEKEFEIEKAEIKILLGAFLGGGRMQPIPGKGFDPPVMQLKQLGGPMSLGGLRAAGALDPTDDGYETLYRLAGGSGNDRPRTGFPNYSTNGMSSPRVAAKVKRASELLNKYGDLLLKNKLISP